MTFKIRRVVTGHNGDGLAIVKTDEIITPEQRLPGYFASTVWCSSEFPVNNDEEVAVGPKSVGKAGRVLFRIGEMRADQPESHAMHRTSTLDYAVILSGECEMKLDSGQIVKRLKAGDVIIQRGTNHAWVPVGPDACRFLFVLIEAEPARVGDRILHEFLDNFNGQIHAMKPT